MSFDLVDYFKKMKIQYKLVILSVLVFGILSQGMGIFNKYSYSDDIGDIFTLGATITSGRWMLQYIYDFEKFIFGDGTYSMPVINGFMSMLYISITACLFVSLYEIKNKTLCVAIGGIMIVFPVITGLFGYIFTLPSYMFSMLMGVFGTYLICKNDNWLKIGIGVLLIGCSVGIYQAFIPVILSTFIIYLIKCCLIDKVDTNYLIKKIIAVLISIISFMAVYFVINKIILSTNNAELVSYQGIDTMGKASIYEYLSRIVYAYGRFFILNSKSRYYMYYSNIKYVYYLIMIIGVVLMILSLIKIYKENRINSLILLLLYASIPLASNFIFVMVDPDYVHALMVYGQVMPFILVAFLLDNFEVNNAFTKYLTIIGMIALLLINVMYCRFDNQCYLKAEFSQQEAISYFTTLVTRIKSTENYDDELPVSFVFVDGGHITDESMYIMRELEYIKVIPYDNMYDYVNNYVWKVFMNRWCGYAPVIKDGEDLKTNKEVLDMTCYPDAGSIKVVDNRVVVRFQ